MAVDEMTRPAATDGGAVTAAVRSPKERFKFYDLIAAQLDEGLADRVESYAWGRCEMLLRAGCWSDPEELTQEAIEMTITGERAWDPDRCNLFVHLCGVISSRTSSMMKHARKFPETPIAKGHDGWKSAEVALRDERGDGNPEPAYATAELAHQTVTTLLSMAEANNDNQVIAILEAYADEVTTRVDVAARIGIGVRKYDHARARLLRLVSQLPDELQRSGDASND